MFNTVLDYKFAETVINCLPELTQKKEQKFVEVTSINECMKKLEEMQKEGYTYKSYIPFGNHFHYKVLVFEK